MADKYRIEERNRMRKPGEPPRILHSNIRRLIALAFPSLNPYHRETIACDYFISALADLEFALKVRERAPANLDDALRVALQLEVWNKYVGCQPDSKPAEIRVRETGKDVTDALTKRIAELEAQIQRMNRASSSVLATASSLPPATTQKPSYVTVKSPDEPRHWRQTMECYGRGAPGQLKRECPDRGPGNRPKKFAGC